MAIDEVRDLDSWESQDFILSEKRYYPIRIEIGHWQLRNYISAPESNVIYYAAREHIFSLNIKTNVRTYLCPLSFTARCTAAAHGYMVVGGGGEGSFAVIHTRDRPYEVDATLPINISRYPPSRSRDIAVPLVTYHILGQEIVNSVSIHKLLGQESGVRDDVVAVITNNDKSVRIFSLTQGKETFVTHLQFAANHASISPCGNLLLAVGDFQEAYFFERSNYRAGLVKGSLFHYASSLCNWEILSVVPLHVSRPAQLAAYFTTAWSPDGRLCAVGSECGFITIFDVDVLIESDEGEDAILAIIPSTRPDIPQPGAGAPGAVRSMIFSPPPWDLLIWGEDQGRICVADIRAGLRVRQVLTIDPLEPELKRMFITMDVAGMCEERPDTTTRVLRGLTARRAQESQQSDVAILAANYSSHAAQRALDTATQTGEAYTNLSAQERQILESLRTSDRTLPHQSLYSRSSRDTVSRPQYDDDEPRNALSTPTALSDFAAELPALTRSAAASGRDTEVAATNLDTIQDYLRRHNQATRSQLSRPGSGREVGDSPVVPTMTLAEETEVQLDHLAFATAHERYAQLLSQRERLMSRTRISDRDSPLSTGSQLRPTQATAHAPFVSPRTNLPALIGSSTSSATTFSQLMNLSGSNHTSSSTANTREPLAATSDDDSTTSQPLSSLETAASRRHRSVQRHRERSSHHRDSPLGRYQQSLINSRRSMTGHPDPHCGPQTAGIAMSKDGETLWCAAECGIWEFKVNVRGRMGCKAEEMR